MEWRGEWARDRRVVAGVLLFGSFPGLDERVVTWRGAGAFHVASEGGSISD